jgi:hypothetical protein
VKLSACIGPPWTFSACIEFRLRLDVMGLVLILHGGTVRLLTPVSAIIAAPTGSCLTYTKAPQGDAVLLWELLG